MPDLDLNRFRGPFREVGVDQVLGDARKSFETAFNATVPTSQIVHEALKIERIRAEFQLGRQGGRGNHFQAFHDALVALLNDREWSSMARAAKFRAMSRRPLKDMPPGFSEAGLTVHDAIRGLLALLMGIDDGNVDAELEAALDEVGPSSRATDTIENAAASLTKIAPNQKIAPAQFDVAGGRLVIAPHQSPVRPQDAANVEAGKAELQKQGDDIIAELSHSNCDPRYSEAIRKIREGLNDPINAVSLGILNITGSAACSAGGHEIPDAIVGMIRGFSQAVGMLVSQYPEWQKFTENALAIELSEADVEKIRAASDRVVAELTGRPDLADPAVPALIKWIKSATSATLGVGNRAAVALMRTVGNLLSKVFQYGGKFLQIYADETIPPLAKGMSRITVVTLLGMAALAAGNMSGLSDKVTELSWIKQASEVVDGLIKQLK